MFYFLIAFNYGPQISSLTVTLPVRLRAFAMSIVLFVGAVIAFGFGPLTTGALSDILTPGFGIQALRDSMAVMSFSLLVPTILVCIAAYHLKRDIAEQKARADRNTGVTQFVAAADISIEFEHGP